MSKQHIELANKIFDNHATHEINEIEDAEGNVTKTHVYRLIDVFGYVLVGVDENDEKARAEIVDVLENDLKKGNLVLSSEAVSALN